MSARLDVQSSAEARRDAAAIARVLEGNAQAFAELVERYQGVLYRHAVAMVLDHDVAADMVQDTFVRAYCSLRECREPARFRAWLCQTLRHRCFDHLKDVRRRTVRLEDAGPIADPAGEPGAGIEREQLRAGLEQALQDLPDLLRETFVMHYVEGLPYETMADLLGASVSALKMRASRAREQLSAALRGRHVTPEAAARLSVRHG
jgi:RNA polymerase sigma-70 factor (ECF subfamily)